MREIFNSPVVENDCLLRYTTSHTGDISPQVVIGLSGGITDVSHLFFSPDDIANICDIGKSKFPFKSQCSKEGVMY